ncbi:hypothetical protein RclHR1_01220060 [Rhizophagus clarus]|uniref:DNA-directed DNA polymerase n=1 Tax=Rhizophagus clarus TaxID=94130 RepID=A0A2Z6QLP1_9GLOM|nr:hypothetical protein RclHR1_01220060 [Rhizophagus clarus]
MPTPICPRIFNKIEEMNPDISINVWEWKEETVTPKPVIASKNIYIPNSCKIENCKHINLNKCQEKRPHVIHLIALTNITKSEEEKYGQKNHFLWIKNPNGLVFKDTAHHSEKHLCNRCFQSFLSEKSLAYHQEHCLGLGEACQRVDLSVKEINDFEQFKNYGRMINSPCVIIADFEAGNKKPGLINGGKTRIISEQYANSFCYLVHWINTGDVWGPFLYRGNNTTQEFIRRIDQELIEINNVLVIKHERKKAIKTIASEKAKADKIKPWKTPIPVVFHNFWGYDSHLVCESVGRLVNAHQIKVILAETFERYKSIKVGQLKYIDSLQFMDNSLANLTKNLGGKHPITSQYFKSQGYSDKQISLAFRKGIYFYDYINSHDRFLDIELPPIYEFHSILKGKISQDDYHHAQKVWKTFRCKNLGEYHDLYLKIDVLSLTDVWTQFRKTCIKYYELDPSHYVSAPSLSWDAMLKKTGVKIELFTDMSMHDFIEKAKKGGISKACKRYFKANNSKMGNAFNPSKPTSWISYVDANNLYGWVMSQFLPIGNYQWEASWKYLLKNPAMQKKYLEKILKTKANASRGYFLNIKSHFSLKTHDYLRDLPPAVENVAVGKDWLNPYNEELVNNLDGGCFSKTEKLVPTLA